MSTFKHLYQKLLNRLSIKMWQLRGYDTFAGDWYALPGTFFSERAAQQAAQRRLSQLEKTQPTDISGGQEGIQDQVYVVRPDGSSYRYFSRVSNSL